MQNIWCERSQRNNKVLDFLLIQIQNTCRCRIRWERSLNCITSSIATTLPEDYLLFINLCFYLFFFLLPLYYSDGDILLVLFRQRLSLAVSPIFSFTSLSPTVFFCCCCCFAPGRLARFHVRPESFRITVTTSPHAASPDNRFCQMLLSAITFVIDVDSSLYSSLHSVENV